MFVRALGAVALLLVSNAGTAQDALQGKRIYLDAARLVGSTVSCVDCHGGLPPGLFGISRAANNPAIVANALNSIPQMTPLRGRLSPQQIADVAAYIGNPGVASPVVDPSARGPAPSLPSRDRIEFGSVLPGGAARGTLVVSNAGAVAFSLTSSARISGPQAGEFSVVSNSCTAGRVLNAAEACEVGVEFRPIAGTSGLRTAALQIDHDWVGGTVAAALIGTAESSAANPPVGGNSGGGGLVPLLVVLALLLGAVARANLVRR